MIGKRLAACQAKIVFIVMELQLFDPDERNFMDGERPVWPVGGQRCHVAECGSTHYQVYGRFLDHWLARHQTTQLRHRCSICGAVLTQHKKCLLHLRRFHCGRGTVVIHRIPNPRYLDPGAALLPKRTPFSRAMSVVRQEERAQSASGRHLPTAHCPHEHDREMEVLEGLDSD